MSFDDPVGFVVIIVADFCYDVCLCCDICCDVCFCFLIYDVLDDASTTRSSVAMFFVLSVILGLLGGKYYYINRVLTPNS